jgi:2-iminobutanoate/2-iminopropanoate deaminase
MRTNGFRPRSTAALIAVAVALSAVFTFLASPALQAQDRRAITSLDAPKAIGPYSQAIVAGSMVFLSGQLGTDPASGSFVEGGVAAQTRQALANIRAVLTAADCAMEDVVSCTVYMKDLDDFAAMNAEYAKAFGTDPPARATVQVARLPKDGLVEISCIAVKP